MTDKQEIDRAVERIMQAAANYADDYKDGPIKAARKSWDGLAALVRAELEARVPHGWRVVPVEPTNEMLLACAELRAADAEDNEDGDGHYYTADKLYAAMLASAPTPQQEKP